MRDLLTEGIPVLDLLEILNSTGKVGDILCLDQSSVSRIYRQVNDALCLNICKHEGIYKPSNNLELLTNLRNSCQALRLCAEVYPIRVFTKPLSLIASPEINNTIFLPDHSFGLNKGLKLLKEKMIDIFVTDGFEILPENLISSQEVRFLAGGFAGDKLHHTSIQLISHPDHPLQNFEKLSGREFWSYPSVAVLNNLFPRLSKQLIARGLWQDHYDLKKYTAKNWEGKTKDRKHIAYANDFSIKRIDKSILLKCLKYDLGLKSCEVALVHRDNIENTRLSKYINYLKRQYASHRHF